MLTYELTSRDLEDVRFAISPAAETVLSLRALRDPGRFPLQLPWVRAVQPQLAGLDWSLLSLLVNDTMGSPDFLTPRPTSPLTQFQDELEIIAAVDRTTFDRQLVAVNRELPGELAGSDGVSRVVDALREYWQTVMAPYWPRMRTVLSADISFRGHAITQHGTGVMLNELGPAISYQDGLLRVDRVSNPSRTERIDGRGLVLQPTLFGPHAVIPFDIGAEPLLGYPPRGQGNLWTVAEPPSRRDLGRLVGTARARILELLTHPRTTSDIAAELKVTPSAVSQHLQLLRRTGLVDPQRTGKQVLYRPTELAALLTGTDLLMSKVPRELTPEWAERATDQGVADR
ncbi:regulatory ArsR family protein [Kribbella steppae]|uniref:Regulatory ArsR family protein n=1 Tax=Kribbella steppae TaxID=2512223 RepID=A0A4R2GYT7_9ACTN|nr:regulatory ArsR family protein [Kribbella steppae]